MRLDASFSSPRRRDVIARTDVKNAITKGSAKGKSRGHGNEVRCILQGPWKEVEGAH